MLDRHSQSPVLCSVMENKKGFFRYSGQQRQTKVSVPLLTKEKAQEAAPGMEPQLSICHPMEDTIHDHVLAELWGHCVIAKE